MSFAGPGKRPEELWQAVAAGVTDQRRIEGELPHIRAAADGTGRTAARGGPGESRTSS
jgi:hypothetical protein